MLLSILLLAATSGPVTDPSATPVTVCVKAALNKRGRFTDTRIVDGSGSGVVDRDALQLVRNTDLSRLLPGRIEPQSGYLLVTADEAGAVTMGFTGKLLSSCSSKASGASEPSPAGT